MFFAGAWEMAGAGGWTLAHPDKTASADAAARRVNRMCTFVSLEKKKAVYTAGRRRGTGRQHLPTCTIR